MLWGWCHLATRRMWRWLSQERRGRRAVFRCLGGRSSSQLRKFGIFRSVGQEFSRVGGKRSLLIIKQFIWLTGWGEAFAIFLTRFIGVRIRWVAHKQLWWFLFDCCHLHRSDKQQGFVGLETRFFLETGLRQGMRAELLSVGLAVQVAHLVLKGCRSLGPCLSGNWHFSRAGEVHEGFWLDWPYIFLTNVERVSTVEFPKSELFSTNLKQNFSMGSIVPKNKRKQMGPYLEEYTVGC